MPIAAPPTGAARGLPTLRGMASRPLSEGNRLQRRYAAWAAPHYARMPAEVREEIERIDRWLYSRAGLGFWLGLLGAIAGTALYEGRFTLEDALALTKGTS